MPPPLQLTPRQFDSLRLMADGLQLKEVGDRLGIDKRTVHEHLGKVYRKMGVDCNISAVREAVAYGIIAIEPRPEGFVVGRKARNEMIRH